MRDRDIHPSFQDITVAVQVPYLLISQSKVEIEAGVSLLILQGGDDFVGGNCWKLSYEDLYSFIS